MSHTDLATKQSMAKEKRDAKAALERAREKMRQASADGRLVAAEYWANYAHDIETSVGL